MPTKTPPSKRSPRSTNAAATAAAPAPVKKKPAAAASKPSAKASQINVEAPAPQKPAAPTAAKTAAPKPAKENGKSTAKQESKKANHERVFISTQATMNFWQELMGSVQSALHDETAQKAFQQKWAALMQDIPKQGFASPDARLKGAAWQSDPFYAQMSQMYGYQSAILERMVAALPLTDAAMRRKMQFMSQQFIDAMSPANFAWSNPEFINKALQTKGESLVEGMNMLLADVQKGRITHVDETQFEVGRNVAVTPGKVIQRTPLYELIEYAPQTDNVSKRPMLFVPPCINKYYIMDLSPENSLVRYAVEQGHHLYLISWRNIDAETQMVEWEHYIGSVIAAINQVREANHGENCNVLGFCVGGTILSTTLAVMAAKKLQLPHSLTLLTTLLDFTEPGDLGVFLSEGLLNELEAQAPEGGVVPGDSLAQVFSILRPRDLVWNYVSQKYLKGEKPRDFDILYWNGDSANLSVKMIAWYLRQCYWNNALISQQVEVLGERVDLTRVNIPTYYYASREDHIVPWGSAYSSARHLGNNPDNIRFVLGASGHIAGVMNPAKPNRRNYWLGKAGSTPNVADTETWFAEATEMPGSWWNDWQAWLEGQKGGEVAAKNINFAARESLDAAPGQYVRRRPAAPGNTPAESMLNPMMQMMEQWMQGFQLPK